MLEEKGADEQTTTTMTPASPGSRSSGLSGLLGAVTSTGAGIISKATSYIPSASSTSTFNEDILREAKEICTNGGIEYQGPPSDPRVSELVFGWSTDSKTNRQATQYFRLVVDGKQAKNGFILTCRGYRGSKFKLFFFDSEGTLLYQDEGKTQGSKSGILPVYQSSMYFTNFDTYKLEGNQNADKSLPSLFGKLEALSCSKKVIGQGNYLLCVYGDNSMIGKTLFNLMVVPASDSQSTIAKLTSQDAELVRMKLELDDFRLDFMHKKAAYEEAVARAKEREDQVNEHIKAREEAYK